MQESIDFRPYLEPPCREISRYTAIFIADDNRLGSGTFVNCCGLEGILTAHHVFEEVFKFDEFLLCVSDETHQLAISRDIVECIPVGPVPRGAKEDEGPDLAFLVIRETGLLAKLREYKSFYSLDNSNLSHFSRNLIPSLWGIAGTFEDSLKRAGGEHQAEPLTRLANLVAVGEFQSRWVKDRFDYIQIKAAVGEHGFPSNYQGISGGGLWLIAIVEKGQGHFFSVPVLGGVDFHQSAPNGDHRILTGHGFDSIYSSVSAKLGKNS